MQTKRCLFLTICASFILAFLGAQTEWQDDARRADEYFFAGDYDVAWLFYERTLGLGCDDGQILFRAAESFRLQSLEDDPDLMTALYAVSGFFLEIQYPDDAALARVGEFVPEETAVNRRFLRRTYARFGAKAPRTPGFINMKLGAFSEFLRGRVDELRGFWALVISGGVREAFAWTRPRAWSLISSILLFSLMTGILLPTVLALTVAGEGRKSYVSAYLFLIHWGVFGVHRFYAGRKVSGFIWFFTGGLFGIGLFFDIFLTGAYIRFWNEDHRGYARMEPVKRVKVKKSPKRSPQPGKAAKPKKAKKQPLKSRKDAAAAVAGSAVMTAGLDMGTAAAPAVEPDPVEPGMEPTEEDFGDLPDLNFDDDGDLAGGLDDDGFDIGTFK